MNSSDWANLIGCVLVLGCMYYFIYNETTTGFFGIRAVLPLVCVCIGWILHSLGEEKQ